MEESKIQKKIIHPVEPGEAVLNQPEPVLKKMSNTKTSSKALLVAGVLAAFLGIGTGYVLANGSTGKVATEMQSEVSTETLSEEGSVEGIDITSDEAPVGVLQKGGSDGEGTHRLDRGLGPEKDVYLLSTVLNLDNFVGKKVQVWGQDLGAKEVGWLIDVVKVKLLE